MTDLERSGRSAVPISVDPTGGPRAVDLREGREGALARPRRLARAAPQRPMFWISAALIVLFVADGDLPAAVHQHRPDLADPVQGARGAVAPTPGSAATARATTSTPGPSTVPGPRSCVGVFATLFTWSSARSSASSPATGAAGSTRCCQPHRRDLPRASRCCSAGSRSSSRFPNDLTTPFLIVRGKVALVLGHPRLADDHAADALQRAAGQAERLRPGRPGARAPPDPDHRLPHPAQLAGLGDRGRPPSTSAPTSPSRRPCPSSGSACSRRPSPGASRSPRPRASA